MSLLPAIVVGTLLLATPRTAASAASAVVLADGSVWAKQPLPTGGMLLRGGQSAPGNASPEVAALDFLRLAASELDVDVASLTYRRTRSTPLGVVVEFEQVEDGTRVLAAEARVLVDREHRVRHVSAALLRKSMQAAAGHSLLEGACDEAALQQGRAISTTGVVRDVQEGIFWRTGERASQYYISDSFGAVGLYTCRSMDCALLDRRILRSAVDVEGGVFNPNPVNTLADATLQDQNDSCAAIDIAAYYSGTVAVDPPTGGLHYLRGQHAIIVDEVPPSAPVAAEAVANEFYYCRDDSRFEEFNAYYWITTDAEYVESLGYTLLNSPIEVEAHLNRPDRGGPFFSGEPYDQVELGEASAGIALTDVCGPVDEYQVDAGEDADVILHEHSHSNFHALRPVAFTHGGEASAINEGSADYWAAGWFWQTSIDNGVDPHCLAEWWSAGIDGGCLRLTNSPSIYPWDVTGEEHDDGEIWAAFMVALALRLNSFVDVDELLLAAVTIAPDTPRFCDMVTAMNDADDILYGGSHRADIAAEADARGLRVCRAPEVSSDTSGRPLRMRKGVGGRLVVQWQDMGGFADGYNVYEGRIPTFEVPPGTDPADLYPAPGCDVVSTPGPAGYLETSFVPDPGNVYYLVSAIDGGTEGPTGYFVREGSRSEHDQRANWCDP